MSSPPAPGFVDPELHAEFPGLRLDWLTHRVPPRSEPARLQRRLADLSNRYRGANVVAMRTQPIPHAYRSFFRQVGLDPDATRIPSEEAAVERLLHGGFRSEGLIDDALLIAVVETGVPVWALDAERSTRAGWGSGRASPGDRLGTDGVRAATCRRGGWWSPTRTASTRCCSARSRRGTASGRGRGGRPLFAVGVDGVPSIHIEEALWVGLEVLKAGVGRVNSSGKLRLAHQRRGCYGAARTADQRTQSRH